MAIRVYGRSPLGVCKYIAFGSIAGFFPCTASAGLPVADAQPIAVVDVEIPPAAYANSRHVLAHIQSNLERVAAGNPRWTVPQDIAGDKLEKIVDAYAFYLKGDTAAMDTALAEVSKTVARRRPPRSDSKASPYEHTLSDRKYTYFETLDTAGGKALPLVRLFAGLRAVDSVLFLEAAGFVSSDLASRTTLQGFASTPAPSNGTWLRLPCRTVIGHVAQITSMEAELKALGGPIFSCPTDSLDFNEIEVLAQVPENLKPHQVAEKKTAGRTAAVEADVPLQHWDREKAIEHMGEHPNIAAPILAKAAKLDAVGKLDYALFLHAFRPSSHARNAKVEKLLAAVRDAATKSSDYCCFEPEEGENAKYDGSDKSLVPTIVMASSSGAVNTQSAFYAIPCAILIVRPKLLEATKERYGGNLDNFLPRSGCSWGRGTLRGFPEAELKDFVELAEEADGHFIDHYDGSLKYGLEVLQSNELEKLKLDPRSFLAKPEPSFVYPYQTWGLLSLNNHAVSSRIQEQYAKFRRQLANYYAQRGLTPNESNRAAKTAIFSAVWGADCGGGMPQKSLRQALLENEPAEHLLEQLTADDFSEPPAIEECARFAGMDPLLLVAVAHPQALAQLLKGKHDVDTRNDIHKTALMVAAQFDQVDSARLLLADKALVNTTTLQVGAGSGLTLSHDARTALMYAAESGSLAMIKLLLDAGADPYQADTKGMRAIDYLLGFGPEPANSKLSPEERATAARWLF